MKSTRINLSAALIVAVSCGQAVAQLSQPSTSGMKYNPNYSSPPTSTSGMRYHPPYQAPAITYTSPSVSPRYQPAPRPVQASPMPPAADPGSAPSVAGTWHITSLRQFSAFRLFVDRIEGGRILYHTSMDSRPRYGNFIAATGFITFEHTDAESVTRQFTGTFRRNSTGRWVLQGTYLGGRATPGSQIWFGER